ncbi:hypothetical protein GCM10010507_02740 [Streptomyces cinnamoneus]|uniref:Uncharacterized protein n=1 Tax=Streptomyces cinnamoneus TaxID=53446 RepID=A0A918TAW8_STRCJ|nr:hypothetical protein GCM10010507_02740 [Streptomyces cinnamoneus]
MHEQPRRCRQQDAGGGADRGQPAARRGQPVVGGAQHVSRTGFPARPDQARHQAVRGQPPVRHAGGARQVRREGPHDRHEAADQQRGAAAALEHRPGALPGRLGQPPPQPGAPQAGAEAAPGALREQVTGHHPRRGAQHHQGQPQRSLLCQDPGAQHQAERGHERTEQQHRFEEHQAEHETVRGRGRHSVQQLVRGGHQAASAARVACSGARTCHTRAGGMLRHTTLCRLA